MTCSTDRLNEIVTSASGVPGSSAANWLAAKRTMARGARATRWTKRSNRSGASRAANASSAAFHTGAMLG
jgi:hypothetical protein